MQKDKRGRDRGHWTVLLDEGTHAAEVAFVVADPYQNQGIGSELLQLFNLPRKKTGVVGFTAEVLYGNTAMLHLFESMGFNMQKRHEEGVYELIMMFK